MKDKQSTRRECPHCGNHDQNKMETNGVSEKSFDYTLLCVARVSPGKDALADFEPKTEAGADGLVACGMQWCPNT